MPTQILIPLLLLIIINFFMGKKDETKTAGSISYSTSRAALRAYGELDDFMD